MARYAYHRLDANQVDNGARRCRHCYREFVLPIKRRGPGEARGVYCCLKCKRASHAGVTNPNFRNAGAKICAGCGKEFKSYTKSRRFCSLPCYQATPEAAEHRKRIANLGYRGGRKDCNQDNIIAGLRTVGASVWDASPLGFGFPDLLVGFNGKNYLLEVKNPDSYYGRCGMNDAQMRWADTWKGQMAVVRTLDDALQAIGAWKDPGLQPREVR